MFFLQSKVIFFHGWPLYTGWWVWFVSWPSAIMPTCHVREGKILWIQFYPKMCIQCTCLGTHYAYKALTSVCRMVTKDGLLCQKCCIIRLYYWWFGVDHHYLNNYEWFWTREFLGKDKHFLSMIFIAWLSFNILFKSNANHLL